MHRLLRLLRNLPRFLVPTYPRLKWIRVPKGENPREFARTEGLKDWHKVPETSEVQAGIKLVLLFYPTSFRYYDYVYGYSFAIMEYPEYVGIWASVPCAVVKDGRTVVSGVTRSTAAKIADELKATVEVLR